MEWVREHIVDLVPVVAAIFAILIYIFIELLEWQKFVIAEAILLFLLAAISLFIINTAFKNDSAFDKINATVDQTKRDSEEFKGKFGEIHQSFLAQGEANGWITDSIKDIKVQLSDIKKESSATVRELESQTEFYRVLNDKVLSAKSKVWLMHLDPYAPDSIIYNDEARKVYFKNCADKAIAQNGANKPVEFRRIINIPNLDKLEWVENLIKETKDIKNLHLAYIHLDDLDIENSFPVSVTSCQIMDNRAVFLLNPELNIVPKGEFKKCIIIENEKVVEIYEEYYKSIWELLKTKNSKMGCIIKDGPGTDMFYKHQQRIVDDINKKPPQSGEWEAK
jgi:hypothetical protein